MREAMKLRLFHGKTSDAGLAPLQSDAFRLLWSCSLVANLCMWMSDVAVAWTMTQLNVVPFYVALVQTASSLPVFLLGLASGAIADTVDRRKLLMISQFGTTMVAAALCAVTLLGATSPEWLLAMTLLNGIGLALRWPAFASLVPHLVEPRQLAAALTLNSVSMNLSRVLGPLVAGLLISRVGEAAVFGLNLVLTAGAGVALLRWNYVHVPHALGPEPLWTAMRGGVQFTRNSPQFMRVLARIAIFFFHSTALLSLIPLIAMELGGDARTYTLMLALLGAGAISAAAWLPRLRQRVSRAALVNLGSVIQLCVTAAAALSSERWSMLVLMYCGGIAWITAANALSVSAQLALPDWVRARGLSIFQMALMGSSALGAASWGQLATVASPRTSLLIAAASAAFFLLLSQLALRSGDDEEDMTPSKELLCPQADLPNETRLGPLLTSVEFMVRPEQADAFVQAMKRSRRSRLRQGATSWQLLSADAAQGRFSEQILDSSWSQAQRRFTRVTAADRTLQAELLAFHVGLTSPRVTRRLMASTHRFGHGPRKGRASQGRPRD